MTKFSLQTARFVLIATVVTMPLSPMALAASSYQPYYVIQAPASAAPAASSQDQTMPAPLPSDAVPSSAPLPTFSYDHKLDPKNVPYVVPTATDVQDKISLGTESGVEIGLQVSDYRYHEDVDGQPFMHIDGPNFGLTFGGNKAYRSGLFWGGDLRLAYGKGDYTGGDYNPATNVTTPSTHSGETNILADTRIFIGHDFFFNDAFWDTLNFSLSPYIGGGFRFLYNDGTGSDSNGVPGYSRYSHYVYIPLGVTPRFRITDSSRLSFNTEFDQLIYGWQVSSIGDSIPGASDVTNSQHNGYGLRASLMYERESWSVGPFWNYWNIGHSNVQCDNVECGDEPHNETSEYGLQARLRF